MKLSNRQWYIAIYLGVAEIAILFTAEILHMLQVW